MAARIYVLIVARWYHNLNRYYFICISINDDYKKNIYLYVRLLVQLVLQHLVVGFLVFLQYSRSLLRNVKQSCSSRRTVFEIVRNPRLTGIVAAIPVIYELFLHLWWTTRGDSKSFWTRESRHTIFKRSNWSSSTITETRKQLRKNDLLADRPFEETREELIGRHQFRYRVLLRCVFPVCLRAVIATSTRKLVPINQKRISGSRYCRDEN